MKTWQILTSTPHLYDKWHLPFSHVSCTINPILIQIVNIVDILALSGGYGEEWE
jgi:hypothetical protein